MYRVMEFQNGYTMEDKIVENIELQLQGEPISYLDCRIFSWTDNSRNYVVLEGGDQIIRAMGNGCRRKYGCRGGVSCYRES